MNLINKERTIQKQQTIVSPVETVSPLPQTLKKLESVKF